MQFEKRRLIYIYMFKCQVFLNIAIQLVVSTETLCKFRYTSPNTGLLRSHTQTENILSSKTHPRQQNWYVLNKSGVFQIEPSNRPYSHTQQPFSTLRVGSSNAGRTSCCCVPGFKSCNCRDFDESLLFYCLRIEQQLERRYLVNILWNCHTMLYNLSFLSS